MIEQETPVEEKSMAKLAEILREHGVDVLSSRPRRFIRSDGADYLRFKSDSQERALEVAGIAQQKGFDVNLEGIWSFPVDGDGCTRHSPRWYLRL